jgi:16S rRNA (guanine966-N2)-methyltransferase
MSEKARGAIFNALGDVEGLTFLDAYAGSGALSIEALSRGASSVLAIDVDIEAAKAMTASVKALGLDGQPRVPGR